MLDSLSFTELGAEMRMGRTRQSLNFSTTMNCTDFCPLGPNLTRRTCPTTKMLTRHPKNPCAHTKII